MRIPIAVKDDDRVGRLQIEAETSCSGAEQEDKVLWGWVVEGLQQCATILRFGGSYITKRMKQEKKKKLKMKSESEGSTSQDSQDGSSLTIKTQVLEVPVPKVVLHDGHEWGHLTEQQDFVVGGSQLRQDAIQQLKLAGGAVQVGSEGAAEKPMSFICDIFTFVCGVQQTQKHI